MPLVSGRRETAQPRQTVPKAWSRTKAAWAAPPRGPRPSAWQRVRRARSGRREEEAVVVRLGLGLAAETGSTAVTLYGDYFHRAPSLLLSPASPHPVPSTEARGEGHHLNFS